jgi:hypothetical protein
LTASHGLAKLLHMVGGWHRHLFNKPGVECYGCNP